ncbi:MAG: hypothetical protein K2X99_07980 [Gemmatimonadaceae bacterium]|nr:hypothetical protein [Gemmatimonadaceae bacterium]
MRSLLRCALVLSVVACAGDTPLAPPPASPAFDPTQLTGGVRYRWPSGRTIAVFVDPTAVPSTLDLAGAVTAGTTAWVAALQNRDFTFRIASRADDADVIIHLRDAPALVGAATCSAPSPSGGGVTFICPGTDTALTLPLLTGPRGRVKVDITIATFSSTTNTQLRALVTHELGHAVGIGGHSTQPTDVMFAAPTTAQLSDRDIQTLRWLVAQPYQLRL